MKEQIIKIVKFADQRRKLALIFSELIEVKIKDEDIVILFQEPLKKGSNIWASLSDDNTRKMPLPIGIYDLDIDRTIEVIEDGTVDKVIYTPTHNEKLKAFIQSFSKTKN